MRTETLWQGERRAARLQWWSEVLDRPASARWDEMFDEAVTLRFQVVAREREPQGHEAISVQGSYR